LRLAGSAAAIDLAIGFAIVETSVRFGGEMPTFVEMTMAFRRDPANLPTIDSASPSP
jgi:hypothetical protein